MAWLHLAQQDAVDPIAARIDTSALFSDLILRPPSEIIQNQVVEQQLPPTQRGEGLAATGAAGKNGKGWQRHGMLLNLVISKLSRLTL